VVVGTLVLVGVAAAWAAFGSDRTEPVTLAAPGPGEVRPDYLADGEPVFVVGHPDGSAQVISAFSTHSPSGSHTLLWWCADSRGFVDPAYGSRWDEYGRKLYGPALTGLPSFSVDDSEGSELIVGGRLGPAGGEEAVDPNVGLEPWCDGGPDSATYHTFDGWQVWDSPSAAVEAAPDGWILLEGELGLDATRQVLFCSLSGCDDSVAAATIRAPDPAVDFASFGAGPNFIGRVEDGVLVDVTRVMPIADPEGS